MGYKPTGWYKKLFDTIERMERANPDVYRDPDEPPDAPGLWWFSTDDVFRHLARQEYKRALSRGRTVTPERR